MTTEQNGTGEQDDSDKPRTYVIEETRHELLRKPRTAREMATIARLVAALRSTLGDAPVPRMVELADGHEFLDTMLIWLRNEAYIRKSYATSARVQRHRARQRHEQALREVTPTAVGNHREMRADAAAELEEARALRAEALDALRLTTGLLSIPRESDPAEESE